jgi:hypothetical protein
VEPQLDRPRRRDLGGPLVIGTIVVLVGVYFLLKETFQVDIPDIGRFWPIAVILIGAWFVYEGALRSRP